MFVERSIYFHFIFLFRDTKNWIKLEGKNGVFWYWHVTAKEINFLNALSIFRPVNSMRDIVKILTGGNLFSKLHTLLIPTWNEWSLQLIVWNPKILMESKIKDL